jgi:SAM-dependent methyltransferase
MTDQEPRNFYATPELARHYDADNPDRRDFRFYLRLADELGSRRVIDLGCGTGALCTALVAPRREVLGLDPQATMLDLARGRPGADQVRWLHGTAADLPDGCADLVVMTGHVAQYFLDDAAWREVLGEAHRALQPAGRIAFEIRNGRREAWRDWASASPRPTAAGTVQVSVAIEQDRVTHVGRIVQDEEVWTTTETLRFPAWSAVESGLTAAGFTIEWRWGDFDGRPVSDDCPEWVVLARRD